MTTRWHAVRKQGYLYSLRSHPMYSFVVGYSSNPALLGYIDACCVLLQFDYFGQFVRLWSAPAEDLTDMLYAFQDTVDAFSKIVRARLPEAPGFDVFEEESVEIQRFAIERHTIGIYDRFGL